MLKDLGEKDKRKQKIKNKINEKHNFLNTKIKEISKLKINNSYLDSIEEEYKLYHKKNVLYSRCDIIVKTLLGTPPNP